MIVHRPPTRWAPVAGTPTVFLAGSIEMGAAPDWQSALVRALEPRDLTILDPRRTEWDASWRQSIDEPQFREQVEWELAGLERADLIAMWFVPQTKSPVTLLELGLFARTGKVVIGCPDGFWRRGNIEVVAARYGVPLVDTWHAFVTRVSGALENLKPPDRDDAGL